MYRLVCVLVLVFCCIAAPAFAAKYDADPGRPYLTLSGGISKVFGATFDNYALVTSNRLTTEYGFNGMVATGLAYKAGRVEISGGYRYLKNDEVKINGAPAIPVGGSLDAFDLLLSAFFDFNSQGAISPYIGGGVGGARVNLDDGSSNKSATGFAYQLGAGVSLNMGDSFAVDLGYRLLGVNNLDFGDVGAADAKNVLFHNANMGLRFIF